MPAELGYLKVLFYRWLLMFPKALARIGSPRQNLIFYAHHSIKYHPAPHLAVGWARIGC